MLRACWENAVLLTQWHKKNIRTKLAASYSFLDAELRRSDVKMLNNTSELIVPCCNPFDMVYIFDAFALKEAKKDRSLIMFHINLFKLCGKFFFLSSKIKPCYHTVSNAFSKSTKQTPRQSPLSSTQLASETSLLIACIAECFARKPNWFSGITFCSLQ